jgi:hypothetical protein
MKVTSKKNQRNKDGPESPVLNARAQENRVAMNTGAARVLNVAELAKNMET